MSVTIFPSLTIEMVLKIFKFLVAKDLRKKQDGHLDYFSGTQEGYLDCLADLFGGDDEDKMIAAFKSKTDWSGVVERIVHDKLADIAEAIEQLSEEEELTEDIDIDEEAEQAVNSYALEHPGELTKALNAL